MKPSDFRKLCGPAQLYFIVETVILFSMIIQNSRYPSDILCVGSYECNVESKTALVIVKLIYIAFWTFILNLMCRGGYTSFAWFLVLLPVILSFIIIGLYMLNKGISNKQQKQKDNSCKTCEGFENNEEDEVEEGFENNEEDEVEEGFENGEKYDDEEETN